MRKEIYLNMPVELDKDILALIKRAYNHATREMGEHEFEYINHKIKDKLSGAEGVKPRWAARLFQQYQCLYEVLKQHELKKVSVSVESYKHIGAALFYFINPYDVIQDFVETIGYADDYYVFILCLKELGANDRKLVETELSKLSHNALEA